MNNWLNKVPGQEAGLSYLESVARDVYRKIRKWGFKPFSSCYRSGVNADECSLNPATENEQTRFQAAVLFTDVTMFLRKQWATPYAMLQELQSAGNDDSVLAIAFLAWRHGYNVGARPGYKRTDLPQQPGVPGPHCGDEPIVITQGAQVRGQAYDPTTGQCMIRPVSLHVFQAIGRPTEPNLLSLPFP